MRPADYPEPLPGGAIDVEVIHPYAGDEGFEDGSR
jgi:hypothetical protein